MPVRLAGVALALLLLAGTAGPAAAATPPRAVPTLSQAQRAAIASAVTLATNGIRPFAGTHTRCRDGSYAGITTWGIYFHMSECVTKMVSDISLQVDAVAGLFIYVGAAIPGGVVVLTYVGLLAATVAAIEGLIWLVDRFVCHNKGVTITISWAIGSSSLGC